MFEPSISVIGDIHSSCISHNLSNANEATTRLRVIDRILFEALNWDKNSCEAESPAYMGKKKLNFLDYALVFNRQRIVVVEAKRYSKTFSLPKEKRNREYKVSTLLRFCGHDLEEVINQSRRYASAKGIPFAVATNGHQWIIFQPYIRGKNWEDGLAIVFNGLDDISKNWVDFVKLLAPENIIAGHLDSQLNANVVQSPSFAKRYNDTRGIDSRKGENDSADGFSVLFRRMFDSIVEDDEMLKNCYVSTDSSRSYQHEFAALLQRATPHYMQTKPAVEDGKPSDAFTQAITAAAEPCVVVLVGHIGSGKTTFINHFFRVHLPERSGSAYYFIKDLKDEVHAVGDTFDSSNAEQRIYEKLLDDVETRFSDINPYDFDVLKQIFWHELVRLKNGPRKREFTKTPDAYLTAEAARLEELSHDKRKLCIALLIYVKKKKGKPLCVVFDNIDWGGEKYQQFIYSLAHNLSREAQCISIVTLRQAVFERARKQGFLDVRNDLIFHVTPPSLRELVSRRIKHARVSLAKSNHYKMKLLNPVEISHLTNSLDVINELVLGESESIRKMLEALTSGNMRLAFDYLRRFSVSGHTDINRLIQIFNAPKTGQRSRFSFRNFFRPFALGSDHRYHEGNSPIVNIFKVSSTRLDTYFLRCRILAFLLHTYVSSEGRAKGEIQVRDLLSAMAACRHYENDVLKACIELEKKYLIERLTNPNDILDKDDIIRISASGNYYLTDLAYETDYLVLISQDTYIYEHDAFEKIAAEHRQAEQDRTREQRAVKEFLDYLCRQERRERSELGPANTIERPWDRLFAEEIGRKVLGEGWLNAVSNEQQTEDQESLVIRKTGKQSQIKGTQYQLRLEIPDGEQSFEFVLSEKVSEMYPINAGTAIEGSRQLARVLWALRLVQLAGGPPVSASDIAKVIVQYTSIGVEATNVARFFRDSYSRYERYILLTESLDEHRYSISPDGIKFLNEKMSITIEDEAFTVTPCDL